MGLFSKKKEEPAMALPKLPELPSLPSEFPEIKENFPKGEIHNLPSFPNNGTGEKFSQEVIKNAISGGEEDEDEEEFYRDIQETKIPKPDFSSIPKAFSEERRGPTGKRVAPRSMTKKIEEPRREERGPVFVRIEKFESAIKIFSETRDKINEIEKLLEETRELKGKEEEELSLWEKEIQGMKQQIEKVDRDIFSKV